VQASSSATQKRPAHEVRQLVEDGLSAYCIELFGTPDT
jgi:hypothetical protein